MDYAKEDATTRAPPPPPAAEAEAAAAAGSSSSSQHPNSSRRRRRRASSRALGALMGLLMLDAAVEFSLLGATVAWLNYFASVNDFSFALGSGSFPLAASPRILLVDQGHTSNAAAGTAFVVVGLGGILALFLRRRRRRSSRRRSSSDSTDRRLDGFARFAYHAWMALQVPALLLTLVALAYTFAETGRHAGQHIDASLAASLGPRAPYPLGAWTPQSWFAALLELDLVDARARRAIRTHLDVARGWQYNLVPLFLIQLAETVAAVVDFVARRRDAKADDAYDIGDYGKSSKEQLRQ